MTKEQIINDVCKKYKIDHSEHWIETLVLTPLDKFKDLRGDQIDFTGYQKYFAAFVEARERIAKEITNEHS